MPKWTNHQKLIHDLKLIGFDKVNEIKDMMIKHGTDNFMDQMKRIDWKSNASEVISKIKRIK